MTRALAILITLLVAACEPSPEQKVQDHCRTGASLDDVAGGLCSTSRTPSPPDSFRS